MKACTTKHLRRLLPRTNPVPQCQPGLPLGHNCPPQKYGQDIQLASYADILSKEVAEEYGDVKSKAEFEK